MHFWSKGLAICKISQQMILKWRKSKQDICSNCLISKESYGSFKSYGCLMNSFKFIQIHLLLSPKQSESSLSFTCSLLFKEKHRNGYIFVMAKIRASSVKIWRAQVPWDKSPHFSSLGFDDNKVFLKCFYIPYFLYLAPGGLI